MGRIDGWVAPRRAPAEIGCVCKANLSNDRCAETRSVEDIISTLGAVPSSLPSAAEALRATRTPRPNSEPQLSSKTFRDRKERCGQICGVAWKQIPESFLAFGPCGGASPSLPMGANQRRLSRFYDKLHVGKTPISLDSGRKKAASVGGVRCPAHTPLHLILHLKHA